MKDFIKQYGAWILVGLMSALILYLIFRPVPVNDNSAAFKTIDSLNSINKGLRNQLTNFAYQFSIESEGLKLKNDTLIAKNDILKFKNDVAYDQNYSLAKQIQYYEAHQDTASYDSACDLLTIRVINDSVTIQDYQINTDKLVQNFSQQINDRDSMIAYQSNLIVSDSLLIKAQGKLNGTQQVQLEKMTKRAKLNAWLARAGAVAIGVLIISVLTK
jgi:hypothetical protein